MNQSPYQYMDSDFRGVWQNSQGEGHYPSAQSKATLPNITDSLTWEEEML